MALENRRPSLTGAAVSLWGNSQRRDGLTASFHHIF
jgi:hypothetical protein